MARRQGGGARPPHLIAVDQIDTWLADSVNKLVTYHQTSIIAARAIQRYGIDLRHARVGTYGHGFYTATQPDSFQGGIELRAAVRIRHPLVGHVDEIGDLVDALARHSEDPLGRITPIVAAGIRQEFLRRGHDGIIVWDAGGDGIDYVIALVADAVKVIEP